MLKSKTIGIIFRLQTVYKLSHIENERRFLALVERTPLLHLFVSDPLHCRLQNLALTLAKLNSNLWF